MIANFIGQLIAILASFFAAIVLAAGIGAAFIAVVCLYLYLRTTGGGEDQ